MFEFRNPSYAISNVRRLPSVRKAMSTHRKENPRCAYCGRSEKVHVHHLVPVKARPDYAAFPWNLMTLCAKRCHITVGHMGNWKTYNKAAEEVCRITVRG
jgi:5-methylcytosine-specific restriction endonuclease McrA